MQQIDTPPILQQHKSFPNRARRNILRLGMGFVSSLISPPLSSCAKQTSPGMENLRQTNSVTAGRLQARPIAPSAKGSLGLHSLELGQQRDGLLYVPATYQPDSPIPLILMLHGAGGDAEGGFGIIQALADTFTTIVLAVDSRAQTWDLIIQRYGPDITFIDRALTQTFSRYAIDPHRIAIGGFSDGASYALSVGIINGDLFTHVIAFSPGFMSPADKVGQPRCFISHGIRDSVLPINQCSRRIVPQLKQAGYDVLYREFEGAHTVPTTIAREGIDWFTA